MIIKIIISYIVFSYVAWYFLAIRNNGNYIGRLLFIFAPLLLPIYIFDRYCLGEL